MKPPQPWRWPLWGSQPPRAEASLPSIPEEQIRPLAERLSKQRPWLSADENWLAAERALKQKPWRPWVIRFSGEKERSGWDWADLSLKVSVPVLILALGAGLNKCTADREERLARQKRESDVVTSFIGQMQNLVISKPLLSGKDTGSNSLVLSRELTIAALAQLRTEDAYQWRNQVLRFVRGLRLVGRSDPKQGQLFVHADLSDLNLSRADLSEVKFTRVKLSKADLRDANLSSADLTYSDLKDANLSWTLIARANLRGADLSGADLRGAFLIGTNLSTANLMRANLVKANLFGANLKGAYLKFADLRSADLSDTNLDGVIWSDETKWPRKWNFKGAKNVPSKLKKQLGLP